MIIADLTRAAPGSETSLLEALEGRIGPLTPQGAVALCFPPQQALLAAWAQKITVSPVIGVPHWSNVARTVFDTFVKPAIDQAQAVGTTTVVSFHVAVLNLSRSVPVHLQTNFRFVHWMAIKTGVSTDRSAASPMPSFPLKEDQVLDCVASALTKRGRPVRMTDLRGLLEYENPAFDKQQSATPPGFVSWIVRLAEAKGLVHVDRLTDSKNPAISLVRVSHATEMPPVAAPPTPSTQVAPSLSPKVAHDMPQRRSDQFFAILRRLDLGPFSVIRSSIYDAIEALAREKTLSCNAIIRRAVSNVKEQQGESSDYPWYPVAKFLFSILGRKPVLLGEEGEAFDPNSPEQMGATVHDLKPDWRAELDAGILEAIITEDKQVVAFDIPDLAAVLFNSRSEESQTRIEQLLKRLQIRVDAHKRFQVAS